MVIKNIYLRLAVGLPAIVIGLALIKVYVDRDRESIWGALCRLGSDAGPSSPGNAKAYLLIGCLAIIGGLIAIFFGFKLSRV